MEKYVESWFRGMEDWLPQLLTALLILVVGFVISYVAGYLTRKLLARLRVNERVARATPAHEAEPGAPKHRVDVEKIAGKVVFYGGLLFVFMAVVESVGMTDVAVPAQDLLRKVFGFIPNLLAAAALGGLAWIVASLLRAGVRRLFAGRAGAEDEERMGMDVETRAK